MYNQRAVMADIYENRRLRLRQLIEERFEGNRTALARAAGFKPSYTAYFTVIFAGRRNLGERAATRIEQALGLPDGWMDSKPPPGAVPTPPYKARMGQPPKVHAHAVEDLLAAGYTQRQTAEQLGVHESTVSRAIQRGRKHAHGRAA